MRRARKQPGNFAGIAHAAAQQLSVHDRAAAEAARHDKHEEIVELRANAMHQMTSRCCPAVIFHDHLDPESFGDARVEIELHPAIDVTTTDDALHGGIIEKARLRDAKPEQNSVLGNMTQRLGYQRLAGFARRFGPQEIAMLLDPLGNTLDEIADDAGDPVMLQDQTERHDAPRHDAQFDRRLPHAAGMTACKLGDMA
ncbi:hypothetical protein HMP06_1314 [Sphingomonas sp. HMP6]|nr:hypothetical protein HMP06_1314 [Sphingomonas sp. HMP6]